MNEFNDKVAVYIHLNRILNKVPLTVPGKEAQRLMSMFFIF